MKSQPMKLTTANIQAGRRAVESDLADAREQHAKAAYAAALDRNDEAARKTLVACKQRLDVLTAELEGLTAAGHEAKRLESIGGTQAAIEACAEEQAGALAAIDAVQAAFEATKNAIAAFGEAYATLKAAELQANKLEGKLVMAGGGGYMPHTQCKPLIEG